MAWPMPGGAFHRAGGGAPVPSSSISLPRCSSLNLDSYKDSQAGRRTGRRHGQRIVVGILLAVGSMIGRSHRHRRGISWPSSAAAPSGQRGPIHRRRPQRLPSIVMALPSISLVVVPTHFSGFSGGGSPGRHDDTHRRPAPPRDAPHVPHARARRRPGAWRPNVAFGAFQLP